MPKNYYRVLGIPADASVDEIKSAYRQRAMESHPDRTGAESEPFRKVQEAYEMLGDPARRAAYDRALRRQAPPTRPGSAESLRSSSPRRHPVRAQHIREAGPLDEFYAAILNLFDDWRSDPESDWLVAGGAPSESTLDVPLSREEARRGGQVRLRLPVQTLCGTCRGRGRYGLYRCPGCGGAGAVVQECELVVAHPPGITSSCRVRVSLDRAAGRDGDLVVRFYVG